MAQLNRQQVIEKFLQIAPTEWTAHKRKLSAKNNAAERGGDDWDITCLGQTVGRVQRLGKTVYGTWTRTPREVGL